MSRRAVDWAYDQPVRPAARKFVLVVLADHADSDGHCYPGQTLLARETGQTERAVRGHLRALEASGSIKRTHRYRKNKTRTSDAFDLVGFTDWNKRRDHQAEAAATAEGKSMSPETDLPEESAGRSSGKSGPTHRTDPADLPEDSSASLPEDSSGSPTGKNRPTYRKISSDLPEESSGYKVVELPEEESGETRAREADAGPGPPSRGAKPGSQPPTVEAKAHWDGCQQAILAALAGRHRQRVAAEALWAERRDVVAAAIAGPEADPDQLEQVAQTLSDLIPASDDGRALCFASERSPSFWYEFAEAAIVQATGRQARFRPLAPGGLAGDPEADFEAWLADLICYRGTPKQLELAAPSREVEAVVARYYAELLRQVTGREVTVQTRRWCAAARDKRLAEAAPAAQAAGDETAQAAGDETAQAAGDETAPAVGKQVA